MKRTICLLLCALLLVLPLSACAGEDPVETDAGLFLWFPAGLEDLTSALTAVPYGGERSVPALLDGLLAGPPEGSGLQPALPAGTGLLGWSLDNRTAALELTGGYGELEGVARTLADYCLTLTLVQLDGVDGVRISVDGVPGRVLRESDVVFYGAEEEPVEVPAALYFRLGSGGTLGYELRVFRLTEDEAPARAVLEALCAGPEDEGLTALLPEGLTVYSVWMDDGICCADLSADLLENVPGSMEEQELVIVSIVDTLCSLDAVSQVQLLVEGEALERYGELDLSEPLLPGTLE